MSKLVNEPFGPRKIEPQHHGVPVIILALLVLILIVFMLLEKKEPPDTFHVREFSMQPDKNMQDYFTKKYEQRKI